MGSFEDIGRDLERRGLELAPIRKLLDAIVLRWHPEQIWLFGSRARGSNHAESDWDLLVLVPDETPEADLDPKVAWELRVRGGVPADIVPCTVSDFLSARDVVNTLSYEAAHHGVLIYVRQ